MNKDIEFMKNAIEEGQKAFAEGDIPVGAVVVYGEKIIGKGRNMRRQYHDPTAHAEIVAIKEAAIYLGTWNLSGCTLYVTLEPCPMCAGALIQSRMTKLVFGAKDSKGGACGSLYDITSDSRLYHHLEVKQGILEEQCRQMLQDFFMECRQKKNKENK